MVSEGEVDASDKVVVLVTGSGLKEPDRIVGTYPEHPEEVGRGRPTTAASTRRRTGTID
jgi:threonine synthase